MFTPMRAGEGFSFSAIDASGKEHFSGPFMVTDAPSGAAKPAKALIKPLEATVKSVEVVIKPSDAVIEPVKAGMKAVESTMRPIEAETKKIAPEAKNTAMKTASEVAENTNNIALPMSGWIAIMHSDKDGLAVIKRKRTLYDMTGFRTMRE